MTEITLTDLTIGNLTIIRNCDSVEEVTILDTTYTFEAENGVYQFNNEGNTFVRFIMDEETKCKVFKKLCPDKCIDPTFYYYTALTLGQYCNDASSISKLCTLYNELIKLLDDECNCDERL